MKEKHGSKLRSALSLFLAVLMIASSFGSVFAADVKEDLDIDNDGVINYVSFGASNTNGFGLKGYVPDEVYENPVLKFAHNVYGYKMTPEKAYPTLIAKALEEKTGMDVHLDQLAISSMRAEELHILLDNEYYGDAYTQWRFTGGEKWFHIAEPGGLDALRKVYQDAVRDADFITVDIGTNNFGVYLSNRIANNMFEADLTKVLSEAEIALYNEYKAKIEELLLGYAGADSMDDLLGESKELFDKIIDACAYAVTGYCVNFDESIENIYRLNPDVNIVVVSIQNLMYGLETKFPGTDELIPFGELYGALVDLANTYAASFSPYSDTYYYAYAGEDGYVKTFTEDILLYEAGDVSTLSEDFIDCLNIYDNNFYVSTRIQQLFVAELYRSLGAGVVDVPDVRMLDTSSDEALMAFAGEVAKGNVKLADIKLNDFIKAGKAELLPDAFEPYYVIYDTALNAAYDTLAQIMKLGAETKTINIMALASGYGDAQKKVLNDIFGELEENVMQSTKGIPYTVELDIPEDPAMKDIYMTILSLGIRSDIGNSFFSHPSVDGHVQLRDAILEAYENGYDSDDFLAAKFEELEKEGVIDAIVGLLFGYVEENKEELADKIYNYLLENPEEVLELVNNQEDTQKKAIILAVAFYLYENYGGQEYVDSLISDPSGTIDKLIAFVEEHGENAWKLIDTYLEASGNDDLTDEELLALIQQIINFAKENSGAVDPETAERFLEAFEKKIAEYLAENGEDDAKELYEYLLANPEKVLAMLEKNGPLAKQLYEQNKLETLAIAAWLYDRYAEEKVNELLNDPDGTIDLLIAFAVENGEATWALMDAYLTQLGYDDMTEDEVLEIINKLADLAVQYGPAALENEVVVSFLEALQRKAEAYVDANGEQMADDLYWFLLENPDKVLGFLEKYGPTAIKAYEQNELAALAIGAWLYSEYGEEVVTWIMNNPSEAFDEFMALALKHGDNTYRLIKKYIDESEILSKITQDDVNNALEYLAELVRKYGPGIAQGLYDWAEEAGYIDQIKEAVADLKATIETQTEEFVKEVQPKVEKLIADLEKFIAEKEIEIADLKAQIENEILPEIERLQKELAEKKAAYDAVMDHIDEYHPEEKEAVIAELENAIKALEAEIKANEAINAQIADAIAAIETEIADVEAVVNQISGKIAEIGEELEKLAKVSENLIKAVEALIKVSVENIDEEAVEAEIVNILKQVDEAVNEVVHHIKYAETITELVTGIGGTVETLGETLVAKAEGFYETAKPQVDAVVTELTKLADGTTPEAEAIIKSIISDVKEIGGLSEELAEEVTDVAETIVKEAEELGKVIADEVIKAVEALKAAVEEAYANATSGEYVFTKDSYYVSIGDGITTAGKKADNYGKLLADEIGYDSYGKLENAGLRAEDVRYILDETYVPDAYGKENVKNVEELRALYTSEIEKADLITVGVGNVTPFVFAQIQRVVTGKAPYEMDWAKLVGEDHVQYIEMALNEVDKYLAGAELGKVMSIDLTEVMSVAAESYAYAYAGFALNYAEMLNDIHEINPEAEVIVVGSYNPLSELAIEIEGEETVVGEYIDYLVELMDFQFLAYSMLTPNTTFVEVNETEVEKTYTGMTALAMDIFLGNVKLNPSANGHEYIKTQILEVLDITVDGLIGDVNLDGKVNAIDATQILRYCNNKASVFTNAKGYKLELINHNADVDYETGINAVDATQILRYCNNKPNTVAR